MKLDNTLEQILEELKDELKNDLGEELSIEEIHEIVQSQIEATKLGIAKGISVHWYGFCKFLFTDRKTRKVNVGKAFERKGLDKFSEEDKQSELGKSIIKAHGIIKNEVISNETNKSSSSLEDLNNIETKHGIKLTLFSNITRKKR